MTLSINIPDAVAQRVIDAFAATYGYQPGTDGTKAQYAKRKVIDYIRQVTIDHEARAASDAAAAGAQAAANTEINPT